MKIRKPFKRNDSLETLFFKFQMLKKKFNSYKKEMQEKDFSLIGNKQEKVVYQNLLNENFSKQYLLKKEIEKRTNEPQKNFEISH